MKASKPTAAITTSVGRPFGYGETLLILVLIFGVAMVFFIEASSNSSLWTDLLPGFFLLTLAIFSRRHQGSWLAPGAFFCLTWLLFAWIPLLLVPEVPVSAWALWWISLSSACAYLGSVLGLSLGVEQRLHPRELSVSHGWPGLKSSIVIFSLVGLVALWLLLRVRAIGFEAFSSLDSIANVGRQFSVARYTNGLVEPLDERLLTTGIYLAALLGGLLLATRPSRMGRVTVFLPFVPATGIALVLTTKASVLFTIVLMTGSYLAARVSITHGGESLLPWKRVASLALGACGLVPIFLFTQLSRYGYSSSNGSQVSEVIARLRIFFLGYLGAFSSWFHEVGLASDRYSLGAYTFAGIFDWLGIHQRTQGIYSEYVYLGPQAIPSNVYTLFRGLIEDYGSVGALAAIATLGFLGGFAYGRLRKGRRGLVPLLAAFYAITLCSFTVSLFTYDTLLLAWIAFASYVFLAIRIASHRQQKGSVVRW